MGELTVEEKAQVRADLEKLFIRLTDEQFESVFALIADAAFQREMAREGMAAAPELPE